MCTYRFDNDDELIEKNYDKNPDISLIHIERIYSKCQPKKKNHFTYTYTYKYPCFLFSFFLFVFYFYVGFYDEKKNSG